jgi:hypothetical protein
LLDDAVRQKRCPRARRLAKTIEGAVDDMKVKPKRKKRLRFAVNRALGPCRAPKKDK